MVAAKPLECPSCRRHTSDAAAELVNLNFLGVIHAGRRGRNYAISRRDASFSTSVVFKQSFFPPTFVIRGGKSGNLNLPRWSLTLPLISTYLEPA